MLKSTDLVPLALHYLPLAPRLVDRFAARRGCPKLPVLLLALRGWLRAVRAQRAHPELPLLGLIVYSYVLGELNASRRNHH